MDKELYQLAEQVAAKLVETGDRLGTAESCTGGWVAKCLTDIPGSSGWFERGYVVYNGLAKQQMLGVPAATIEENGEVSEAVVRSLAEGVLANSNASISLSISGIAGPGGGSAEKPVGTVWFAWSHADKVAGVVRGVKTTAETQCFSGDREAVRRQAVIHVMQGVLNIL
ncbi:MAG: nicotinamide-nucleotide amidohydrolase family protein [Sulfuriflexus sp.]|nr:nicotinamide-nucleotide amidohydrolase family protein [Sulfuriflexus sp.]